MKDYAIRKFLKPNENEDQKYITNENQENVPNENQENLPNENQENTNISVLF
jgi:hypothetical protein